jgi:uncharacterized protein YacL
MGLLDQMGYEDTPVLDYFLVLTFVFALITIYFEQNRNIEFDKKTIRQLVIYDIIYTGIGLVIGLIFVIFYFVFYLE